MPASPFERTLNRVDGLLALHSQVHGGNRGRPRQHTSDVLRGALVLTMAALDAVVLDSVLAAVPELARQGRLGSTPAKWVKAHPNPLEMVIARRPIDALVDCCRDNLSTVTFQRAAMIAGVLRDTLGCDPPWDEAAQAVTAATGVTWTADEVVEYLDRYVDRRNRIAHDGDTYDNGSTVSIRRDYVEVAVHLVRAVGHSIEVVIAKHVAND